MAPPLSQHETARRRELSHMQRLDEGAQRGLFALCELAADIANAPGAAIILPADEGPDFIATISNISLPDLEAVLGTYPGGGHEPLLEPVAAADSGMRRDPDARSAGLCFSASLALETAAGLRIGTLCILDDQPRNLPESLIAVLQHAATAATAILAAQREPVSAAASKSGEPDTRETRTQIRQAIGNGEFVPFYQPNVELKWGRIIGFEVLARWQHPVRGLLSPEEFNPAIYDPALTPLLTRAILNSALKDYAAWRSSGLSPRHLAINVGSGDLMSETFAEELLKTLDIYGFGADDLVIEVTEGITMGEPDGRVHKALSALRERGVRVVLDDFGTGFAGLQHLRNWPIDGLKLDRDFVRNCLTNKEDQIIIRSMVQMCRDLKLEIVAEGIEDNAQYLFLSNIGCDFGQGYYFGRPSAAADVPELLRGAAPEAAANLSEGKPAESL